MRRLLAAMLVIGGCRIADIDLTGKPCPCPSGWRCDDATQTCARSDGGASDDGISQNDGGLGAFGVPTPLPGAINTSSDEVYPTIDGSGLQLFFGTPQFGGYTVWYAVRTTKDEPFGPPLRIVELDGTGIEYQPEISSDALELIFNGNMPALELRQSTRTLATNAWGTPANVISVQAGARDGASISPDGMRMYLAVAFSGGIEEYARTNIMQPWTLVRAHPALINMSAPSVSGDGLEIYLANGSDQLYRATRPSLDAVFGAPQRVMFGSAIDNARITDPELDSTGRTLYLAIRMGGDFDLYVATR